MKKIALFFLLAAVFSAFNAYALDFKILNMRNQIFEQSRDIKALTAAKSRDTMILISLFNSCLMTATELDAYFSMLGIFEALSKQGTSNEAAKFIVSWLKGIKNTNTLNVQSFAAILPAEPRTKAEIKKLKDNLVSLNTLLDIELGKFIVLRAPVKKQRK
jgi:hypothetical protein